jgi:hypothetical protein
VSTKYETGLNSHGPGQAYKGRVSFVCGLRGLELRSGTIPGAGALVPERKAPPDDGAKGVMMGPQGHSIPVHVRGPTRPNWGGDGFGV